MQALPFGIAQAIVDLLSPVSCARVCLVNSSFCKVVRTSPLFRFRKCFNVCNNMYRDVDLPPYGMTCALFRRAQTCEETRWFLDLLQVHARDTKCCDLVRARLHSDALPSFVAHVQETMQDKSVITKRDVRRKEFLICRNVAEMPTEDERDDDGFMYVCVIDSLWRITQASSRLLACSRFMRALISHYAAKDERYVLDFLSHTSSPLYENREFILFVLRKNGLALQYASHCLRNDIEVVNVAIENDFSALQYASNELRSCESVVLKAVRLHGAALEWALGLSDNFEIVLTATKTWGLAIEYAAPKFRRNRKIVLSAVSSDPVDVLPLLSEHWRSDPEVLRLSLAGDGNSLPLFAPLEQKLTMQLCSLAIESSPCSLRFLPAAERDDKELVLKAVSAKSCALAYASERLRDDKEIVRIALRKDPCSLKYASKRLRDDIELVLLMIQLRYFDYMYSHEQLYELSYVSPRIQQLCAQHVKLAVDDETRLNTAALCQTLEACVASRKLFARTLKHVMCCVGLLLLTFVQLWWMSKTLVPRILYAIETN